MNQYKKMQKTIKVAKKSMKKAGRSLSGKLLATATVGALLPFEMKKLRADEYGDDAYVFTSLLISTTLTPKREDSVAGKTSFSIRLRTPKEIGNTLKKWESALPTPERKQNDE